MKCINKLMLAILAVTIMVTTSTGATARGMTLTERLESIERKQKAEYDKCIDTCTDILGACRDAVMSEPASCIGDFLDSCGIEDFVNNTHTMCYDTYSICMAGCNGLPGSPKR